MDVEAVPVPVPVKAKKPCASARKKQRIKTATPTWADPKKISLIYDDARSRTKATANEWHVDHVVPIYSKLVCGLHCEANLRVITKIENFKKANHHWPQMP